MTQEHLASSGPPERHAEPMSLVASIGVAALLTTALAAVVMEVRRAVHEPQSDSPAARQPNEKKEVRDERLTHVAVLKIMKDLGYDPEADLAEAERIEAQDKIGVTPMVNITSKGHGFEALHVLEDAHLLPRMQWVEEFVHSGVTVSFSRKKPAEPIGIRIHIEWGTARGVPPKFESIKRHDMYIRLEDAVAFRSWEELQSNENGEKLKADFQKAVLASLRKLPSKKK